MISLKYKCAFLITFMETILSENEIEILNDAIQCYGRHPEDHSYASEIDDIKSIALAFDQRGYNKVCPEFDILRPVENRKKEQDGIKERWRVRFVLSDGSEHREVLPSRFRLILWVFWNLWRCRCLTIFPSDFYDECG